MNKCKNDMKKFQYNKYLNVSNQLAKIDCDIYSSESELDNNNKKNQSKLSFFYYP